MRTLRFARWKTPRPWAKTQRRTFDSGPKTPARLRRRLPLVNLERGGPMALRRLGGATAGAGALALALPAVASADTLEAAQNGVLPQSVAINSIWVVVAALLV